MPEITVVLGQDDWLFFARSGDVLVCTNTETHPAWLDAPHSGDCWDEATGQNCDGERSATCRRDNAHMLAYATAHPSEFTWEEPDPDPGDRTGWPLEEDEQFAARARARYLPAGHQPPGDVLAGPAPAAADAVSVRTLTPGADGETHRTTRPDVPDPGAATAVSPEDHAAAEQKRLEELQAAAAEASPARLARMSEIHDAQMAAYRRVSVLRGQVTRARRAGDPARIASAQAKLRAASAEADTLSRTGLKESAALMDDGFAASAAVYTQLRVTWDAHDRALETMLGPEGKEARS